jgi:hypothetical protein
LIGPSWAIVGFVNRGVAVGELGIVHGDRRSGRVLNETDQLLRAVATEMPELASQEICASFTHEQRLDSPIGSRASPSQRAKPTGLDQRVGPVSLATFLPRCADRLRSMTGAGFTARRPQRGRHGYPHDSSSGFHWRSV